MAALNVGVLGGTFDPPHNGHLALARAARQALDLERIIWVPAGDPWRKVGTFVSPGKHRLAMLRLAVEGEKGFEVDTGELDREGPSYTVDSLTVLHDALPTQELVFLLGADALEDLPNWHRPDKLIRLAWLGATERDGAKPTEAMLDSWVPGLSQRVLWFEMPRIDISATDLRRRAAAGEDLAAFVPAAVEDYIFRHSLYNRS